ncbi:MAG: aminotransferase class V-fold PLP-dependent enzyme [Clostridiales Family XIII bacterium]|jgi:cysteine desulfurase family protein|nr:aminotransferase class V-fold PLP-dependent enzyme [Clostridiales Family XIII bacterium]
MIYLDNAATSWPKPQSVCDAVSEALRQAGNPGRSGHALSLWAGRVIEGTRMNAAALLGERDASRVVFALNATDALNTAIHGLLAGGGHAITTSMEHNSVIRPLETLRQAGVIRYTCVPTDPIHGTDPAAIRRAFQSDTRLVICTHASNVTGTVNPVGDIGRLCREAGIPFLVDAAQTAGSLPLCVDDIFADMVAFPGHKGLLGPQGTGGLWIRADAPFSLPALRQGGTGSRSERISQPAEMPDRFESGTQNTPGLHGLAAGIRHVLDRGVSEIFAHEARLTGKLLDGLSQIRGVTTYGPSAGMARAGVLSLRIADTEPSEAASILDNSFGIAVRAGLHCAPAAHETIGTLGTGGTVRASVGAFTTDADVDAFLHAVSEIAQG